MEQVEAHNIPSEKTTDIESKVLQLEIDNKRLRDEFNIQRAKLKDLFLQKEGELDRKNKENAKLSEELTKLKQELDEAKSQLVVAGLTLESNITVEKRKAEEEIASLQQLVHETVEESSTCKTIYDMEIKKLYGIIQQLETENQELKTEKQQSPQHSTQEQTSLAPSVVLSNVKKTLARKLGADSFVSQDNTDDVRKVDDDDHAQEDVEVLRSLVMLLENEVKVLKDKLRTTDEQLQKCQQCRHFETEGQTELFSSESQNRPVLSTATNTSFDTHSHSPAVPCDMCSNYEAELVKEQKRAEELQGKVVAAEKASERHREELLKEIGFRKEIEEKWNEKKEQHKHQVAELTTRTDCAEQDLKEVQEIFKQTCAEVKKKVELLTRDRENVQQELEKLQKENDNLVGKYSLHSQQLQSEMINLPNTVEELQEVILRAHQDLIIAKVGKEVAEEQVNNLSSDYLLLNDKIAVDQQLRETSEANLMAEIKALNIQKHQLEKEIKVHLITEDKLESLNNIHEAALAQIVELNKVKKQLEDQVNELKGRVGSLQQELDNSEAVQKDFVRLSQSLQVQLEKIRDSDTQVRWQHEEDVDDCPTCRSAFSVTKRKKQHCRHCGQIFCVSCLTHTVLSGPNQRPSKVCDVCHTLLVKSSAPYFSTEVPHSPD